MSEQLSALDATFLELEEADDAAHMHIGAILIFDHGPHGPPSTEALCTQIEERLHLLPRFRDRLSERRTGGLRWPAWEPDPEFDVTAPFAVRRCRHPVASVSCSTGQVTTGPTVWNADGRCGSSL